MSDTTLYNCKRCHHTGPATDFMANRHGPIAVCKECWRTQTSATSKARHAGGAIAAKRVTGKRRDCTTCGGSFPAKTMLKAKGGLARCHACAMLVRAEVEPRRLLDLRRSFTDKTSFCTACKSIKPKADFWKYHVRWNGVREQCKPCMAKYYEKRPGRRALPAPASKRAQRATVEQINATLGHLNGSTEKVQAALRDVWREVAATAERGDATVERILVTQDSVSITYVRTETIPL